MITKKEFIQMFSSENEILLQQTAGITHADSLLQPPVGGNCMNWVMGHLVVNLVDILHTLGVEAQPALPELAHYAYGSDPIHSESPGVIQLQTLIDDYAHLTTLVCDQLNKMKDVDFDEEIDFWQGKRRRGYVVFFYYFHNTYHLGQLEQLRNLAGKTGKVI